MTDFLLELRSEEIPARMQDKARDDLVRLFTAELAKAELAPAAIVTFATPRRLALIARGLPEATEAISEEVKGPKTSAPPQALDGFLRKTGLTREQLTERDGVFFAISEKPGLATAVVLAEAIPAIIRTFPWPKSMRWGAASASPESLRWVRPLHGIVALFGEDIVPVEIAGIASGATTYGHRFHHPGPITIGSAADYEEKLRACHVIVDQDLRRTYIRQVAEGLADVSGLQLIEDEGLVAENAGLTEWPEPILGFFDEDFLSVPPEVIQLTARVNQKYFVCRKPDGSLANAFVCVANIKANDGGAKIVEGNRKVLAARLADARFFYDTDLKVPLGEQAGKLDRIVFHEKLGTVADKVERVAKLARWLVEEGIVNASPSPLAGEGRDPSRSDGKGEGGAPNATPADTPHPSATTSLPPSPARGEGSTADLAERAARLCKADLVTGMVGEFPELQGLMGGYYAAAQGEHPAVAAAIRDHYKPVGQTDAVPTDPVTVAVSLADKLDTIGTFFSVDEKPTGSKDPFALRRAAIAVIALVTRNRLRLPLRHAVALVGGMAGFQRGAAEGIEATQALAASFAELYEGDARKVRHALARALQARLAEGEAEAAPTRFVDEALAFFADRLKVQQREAGVRHDLIDAVFAAENGAGEDDLVRLLARVRALQAFVGTEDGANLLAGYKRAANILKKEGFSSSPLPVGEGQGASAPRGEDGGEELPSPDLAALGHPLPRGERTPLSYTPEKDEATLIAALDAAEPRAAAAVAAEDFEGAMAALASLRPAVDAFFDTVTVNDPVAEKRAARLALLARVRGAVHAVADFAKIEG